MGLSEQIRGLAAQNPALVTFFVSFALGMLGIIAAYAVSSGH